MQLSCHTGIHPTVWSLDIFRNIESYLPLYPIKKRGVNGFGLFGPRRTFLVIMVPPYLALVMIWVTLKEHHKIAKKSKNQVENRNFSPSLRGCKPQRLNHSAPRTLLQRLQA